MEKIRKLTLRWIMPLVILCMVLVSATGCDRSDVDTAVNLAAEVLEVAAEVAAEMEAMEAESEIQPVIETLTAIEPTIEPTIETKEHEAIEEDGHYCSKEEVALYLHIYGKLPSNYITKQEAEELGWKKKDGEAGQLHVVAPGMSIGGNTFGNYEGLLPKADGRKYYQCDINYVKGNRGAERIIYSNDGLIFYTGDHYESFEQLYPKEP